ncbi:MAG: cobalt transporter [Lachnospiraceae bacterium]|nr:cobalt transporter [Lachnospiraceae bacterium]
MHLIQDENGNPIPHGHEHEHMHTHTYEHSHPHTHEHGHEEEHDHTHGQEESCHAQEQDCGHAHAHCGACEGHSHEEPQGDKMVALLDYMLKHNEHHAAELDQVAEKFRADGKGAAAEQIKKAVDEFQKGNLYLKLALSMVQDS